MKSTHQIQNVNRFDRFFCFGTEISSAEQKPDGTVVFDERYGKI
ncbi:hypothetical protein [Dehalobacter sp. TBBPA1]